MIAGGKDEPDNGSLRSCEQDADNWQLAAGRLVAW